MPGKPKRPNKQYSPNWGGKREGAGNQYGEYPLNVLKIACTDEEFEAIRKLTTRERTEILLAYIERMNNR